MPHESRQQELKLIWFNKCPQSTSQLQLSNCLAEFLLLLSNWSQILLFSCQFIHAVRKTYFPCFFCSLFVVSVWLLSFSWGDQSTHYQEQNSYYATSCITQTNLKNPYQVLCDNKIITVIGIQKNWNKSYFANRVPEKVSFWRCLSSSLTLEIHSHAVSPTPVFQAGFPKCLDYFKKMFCFLFFCVLYCFVFT